MGDLINETTQSIVDKVPWLISNLKEVGISTGVVIACFSIYFLWPRFAQGLADIVSAFRKH